MKRFQVLLFAVLFSANLFAQHTATSATNTCYDCSLPISPYIPGTALKESPAFPEENSKNLIFSSSHIYVYRLAVCISPEVMSNTFKNDKTQANTWLDNLYTVLNEMYVRDLGIRFEQVRDDKLLMSANETGFAMTNDYGTKIFDALIGTERYDAGILVVETKNGEASGRASLGGVGAKTGKGNAHSIDDPATIAHELGHLFGARHPHICQHSILVEPGKGQSVMSYGEPRTFFSLPSTIEIRQQLSEQNYYLDATRNPDNKFTGNPIEEHDNDPYVEDAGEADVCIAHKAIRDEYVVTLGTRFQFYIPAAHKTLNSTLYAAHPYDMGIGEDIDKHHNAWLPTYQAQKGNSIMFQPYYDEPQYSSTEKQENKVPYSDNYREGLFTFLLGAFDRGRYDTHLTRVRVVKGEKFSITSSVNSDYNGGEPVSLHWTACHELYGKDSKVRILLSDDFGQTYKYVLADNIPNSGNWQGYMPFIKIGRVNYRNLKGQIRGGVIKIEVKGEAAYAVTHEIPYVIQGTEVIYTGGLSIAGTGKWILFRDAPEPYLEVNSEEEIPAMQPLEVYHKNYPEQTQTIKGTEERHGNHIRRTWLCNGLNGSKAAAYTQIIIVKSGNDTAYAAMRNTAENLRPAVQDLLVHRGEIGYPLPELQTMQELEIAAQTVYDENFKVKTEIRSEDVTKVDSLINQLSAISIAEIVKPQNGARYLLRNYRALFGQEIVYYLRQRAEPDYPDPFVATEDEATVWTCAEKDGKYTLTANGRNQYMQIFNSNGAEFTLERGCTWGAFTLVNMQNEGAQLRNDGSYLGVFAYDPAHPKRQYFNSTYSSDFQFVPVADNPTGISIDKMAMPTEIQHIYSINGIRLTPVSTQELPAGIYIINGKKQIIR